MTAHESLTQVRHSLLDLHKALIERERAAYEKGHGAVTPAQMLQLLIRDSAFSWLHPISELIVRVDELISNASDRRRPTPSRPAMTPDQIRAEAEILLVETRELLTAGDAPGGFRERYDAVLQSDPAIVLMHRAVMSALPSSSRHHATSAPRCSLQSCPHSIAGPQLCSGEVVVSLAPRTKLSFDACKAPQSCVIGT